MTFLIKKLIKAVAVGGVLASTLVATGASAATTQKTVSAQSSYGYLSQTVQPGEYVEFSVSGSFSYHSSGTHNWCKAYSPVCNDGTAIRYKVYTQSGKLVTTLTFQENTKRIYSSGLERYRIVLSDSYYSDNRGSITYRVTNYPAK